MFSITPMNKTRIKPLCLFRVGSTVELSIFLILTFAHILCVWCVCVCACHHALACLFTSLSPPLPFVCVSLPALQLCGTSCVCLLYLVNLLQESRLPAEAPSLHITPVILASLPGGLLVYLKNTHWMHSWVICNWSCAVFCVHDWPFVPYP